MCEQCRPPSTRHARTTAQRGYGNDWRKFSERQRILRPLCELCDARGKATPTKDLHHIQPIRTAPHLRMDVDNTLAVCQACHDEVEGMGPLELAALLDAELTT